MYSDVAQQAFKLAAERFSIDSQRDDAEKNVAAQLGSIDELHKVVKNAVDKYGAEHDKRPVYKWITKFSKRIMYYGNIMDVLVQQHPEYVSLAWGAMKFIFVVRPH